MYNSYLIRKQKGREFYLPTGKPNVMYHYLKTGRNYSTPPDPELLTLLEDQSSQYDDTAYLSPATRVLYDDIVLRSNIPYDATKILPGLDQLHTQIYRLLRVGLFELEQAGTVVEELETPTSALDTINTIVQRFRIAQLQSDSDSDGSSSGVLQGEKEVEGISDSEDEAQNDDELELGDDGDYFEPY